MRVSDGDDELPDPQALGVAERGGLEVVRVGAQDREVGERVRADDLEAQLAPVRERGAAGPVRAGDHVRRGEQEAVGCQRHAAARSGGHAPAAGAAGHPQVGHRGGDPLGHVDDDPGIGVERLGVALGRRLHHTTSAVSPKRTVTSRSSSPRTTVSFSSPSVPAASSASYRASTPSSGPLVDRHEQVSVLQAGAVGRAAVLHAADEHAVALGQPDRAAQAPGHAGRDHGDAEAGTPRRLALPQGVGAAREALVGGDGEDEAALAADGIEAQQPSLGIDQRAAGRAAGERGGVLDRPGDPPAPRPAEAPGGAGHEARRHAQAATAGIGEREHGGAERRRSGLGRPGDGLDVARVDLDRGEVEVGVDARHAAALAAAVGERHGDLVAAQVVGVGEHAAGADDDAAAAPPPAAQADDGGADSLGRGLDGGREIGE